MKKVIGIVSEGPTDYLVLKAFRFGWPSGRKYR